MGVILPKVFSRTLAKIAIKTGLYQLFMRKYMRLMRQSARQALDEITDNEEFKSVVLYIFGDMGKVLMLSLLYYRNHPVHPHFS